MKKYFSIWSMVVLMTMCVGFSSCSKDDDGGGNDNSLVGKWEAIEDFILINGSWESDYKYTAGECIWTIDNTHIVSQDKNDLMSGQKIPYSYNSSKKELTYLGMTFNVLKLTSTEFELEGVLIADKTYKMKNTFKKIQ